MQTIILTFVLIALMSFMAAGCLAIEGEIALGFLGAFIGFLSFRTAGWFEHNYA
ncbi:MAG: hypothetical protein ACRC8R_11965 [Aeromonas hydrophila]